MHYYSGSYKIIKNIPIADGIYDIMINAPDIAQKALPGQFINISTPPQFLPRPISICEVDKESGVVRFIFEVRGAGTKILSNFPENETLDIIGPLGNGYTPNLSAKHPILVGGGIGIFPLLELAKSFNGKADVILGFRSADKIVLQHDFENICKNVFIMTDDGSAGRAGLVTELLQEQIDDDSSVYCCGPTVMQKAISKICIDANIPCQVSLEERMACGVGACLCCACGIESNGKSEYKHVCKDGPVFDARCVKWD